MLTVEVAGANLGLSQDRALLAYLRRHYAHCFLRLCRVHRTTAVRQADNLRQVKGCPWQRLLDTVPYDPQLAILDSLPLPVCQCARATRCRRFRGEAAYGKKDHVIKQTFYGFRLQARVCWVFGARYLTQLNGVRRRQLSKPWSSMRPASETR